MSDPTRHVLEGWAQGELRVQRCEACRVRQFPPRAVCLACRADTFGWEVIAPQGTIASFTIVHRAPTPAWKARTPYAIALVDCVPGVRLMMNVQADNLDALAIGDRVAILFEAIGDQRQPRPCARVTAAAPAG